MATIHFEFQTGIKRPLFQNVRLLGDWNSWDEMPMQQFDAPDGCPAFRLQVTVPDSRIHHTIKWGLRGDAPSGSDQWLIPTEVKHPELRDRHREFRLSGNAHTEVYRFNIARFMGANKHVAGNGDARTQFAVWAPLAQKAEVVFGSIWDGDTHDFQPFDLTLPGEPLPVDRISGGYISDAGEGKHPARPVIPMKHLGDGVWVSDPVQDNLPFDKYDHRLYMYRITREDGSQRFCTDIYSRCQVGFGNENPDGHRYAGLTRDLDGSVSCSAIIDPDRVTKHFEEDVWPERHFIPAESFWQDEFPEGNRLPKRLEDLVIYELHLGALGFGSPGPGTIKDARAFLNYLEDLGVNAIELLPLAEFGGGAQNWGYATSHYFAIEYGGGGRDKFKFFIRDCHRRGIAVIMDVVFNHYVHNAVRAQWQYSSPWHDHNAFYWYEGHPDQYQHFNQHVAPGRRGTGGYIDNESTAWAPRYHEEIIRQMFISSMIALVEEFHVDGFRVDQTTSIHAYNRLHADGSPVSSANAFGAKLLRELTRTLRMVNPGAFLTAEDHSNDLGFVVRSPDENGLGFDAAWYSNFYHNLVGDTNHGDAARLLAEAGYGDDRELNIDGFAAALSSSGHRRVVYAESHDEAGNGSGTARNIRVAVNRAPLIEETRRYAEARVRYVASLALLSAGTPMLLFGDEVGVEKDFLYSRVLENRDDLPALRRNTGEKLFEFYKTLIRLRRDHPGLRSRNIEIVYTHNRNRMLAFRRWEGGQQFLIVASLNNHAFNQPTYYLDTPLVPPGSWREIFNSDSRFFKGNDVGNGGGQIGIGPNGFECVVPANGVLVFQKDH